MPTNVPALICVAVSASGAMLLAAMAAMGFLAVVTQAFVAYAASLARPEERGQVVGSVTSGIVLGILLARAIAGAMADLSGWRAVYLLSAAATLIIASILFWNLPAERKPPARLSYARLIGSLFTLFRDEKVLRNEIVRASKRYEASRKALEVAPEALRHVVDVGLRLAGTAGLCADGEHEGKARFRIPQLDRSWDVTLDTLRPPRGRTEEFWEWRKKPPLPVTFHPLASLSEGAEQLPRPRLRLHTRRACGELRQDDVLLRREFRQQVVELVDEADRAAADRRAVVVGQGPRTGSYGSGAQAPRGVSLSEGACVCVCGTGRWHGHPATDRTGRLVRGSGPRRHAHG